MTASVSTVRAVKWVFLTATDDANINLVAFTLLLPRIECIINSGEATSGGSREV